jgi:hypothetical protein
MAHTMTIDEIGALADRLVAAGITRATAMDGADWREVQVDMKLAAKLLLHLVVTGVIYTTIVFEGGC